MNAICADKVWISGFRFPGGLGGLGGLRGPRTRLLLFFKRILGSGPFP